MVDITTSSEPAFSNQAGLNVDSAAVTVGCDSLPPTLDFFCDALGFAVEAIWPADEPSTAVISGYGTRLRLDESSSATVDELRLGLPVAAEDLPEALVAPNGTQICFESSVPVIDLPPLRQKLEVSKQETATWGVGRAGMRYRDLLPSREGGRFIASHIHIPDGGPVPDYVHFHHIRFQLIFVRSGWVRVVYEDQGDPFVMYAGDCVLQPPLIRHRVLESSEDLEVIEIGCPAEHRTEADPNTELPTETVDSRRDFSGQRFVRHVATDAVWQPWRQTGWDGTDTGIAEATNGLATVEVVRGTSVVPDDFGSHNGELRFLFVLDGELIVDFADGNSQSLSGGDSIAIPAELSHKLSGVEAEFLSVEL